MSIQFPITIKIVHEAEATDAPFVAYIPEFDISSCGRTEAKAKKNVKEALELVLEEVNKNDTLDDFLKEAGISKTKKDNFPKISFEPFVFQS